MSVIILPLVGLVWETDFDPTTMGGVPAPLGQFLIRTDTNELYYKSGLTNTDWTPLTGGGGGGGTGVAPIPEQWCTNGVPANTAATAMEAQLSTNLGTYRAIRAGSLTGLSWRFSETITAGQITLNVRKNGVAVTLAGVSTNASNQNGGQTSQAAGVDTFVAGDLFDITYTTDAGFLPITTDVEAVLDAVFAAP